MPRAAIALIDARTEAAVREAYQFVADYLPAEMGYLKAPIGWPSDGDLALFMAGQPLDPRCRVAMRRKGCGYRYGSVYHVQLALYGFSLEPGVPAKVVEGLRTRARALNPEAYDEAVDRATEDYAIIARGRAGLKASGMVQDDTDDADEDNQDSDGEEWKGKAPAKRTDRPAKRMARDVYLAGYRTMKDELILVAVDSQGRRVIESAVPPAVQMDVALRTMRAVLDLVDPVPSGGKP